MTEPNDETHNTAEEGTTPFGWKWSSFYRVVIITHILLILAFYLITNILS